MPFHQSVLPMKNALLFCFIALFFGCQHKPAENTNANPTAPVSEGLTPSQQKAVLLAGTSMSGQASGALADNGRSLELTISNSAVFNQEADLVLLHASRAAWVFYQNMGEDKPSFENLVVKAQLKDTTFTLPYKLTDLAIVKARYPTVEKVAKLLIAGDYEQLYTLFDPSVMGVVKVEGLRGYCTQIEPQYGKPLSFDFRGFQLGKTSSGQDNLSLAGNLKREQKDTPLNILIDLSKPNMEGSISSLKFDY
jgi:hypothetical protein